MSNTTGVIVGALAGLMVTIIATLLWPLKWSRALRIIVPPVLGFGVAYLVMRLV